jgi:hypothetical protein
MKPDDGARPRVEGGTTRYTERDRGQALVEFALVIPIIAFIFLGIVDLSRVFTSQLVVESAAREAADFGAFNSSRWTAINRAATEQEMTQRACVASNRLEDYAGPDTDCLNPRVDISLEPNGGLESTCGEPDRPEGPCLVRVDMTYQFDLIIPFGLDFNGTRLGLPDQLTFQRTSIFAVSDFSVDQP